MRWGLFLMMVPLAACQTDAERREAANAADDAACRSYGLTFGTPAYAECRQRRDAAQAQQALALLGAMSGQPRPAPIQPYMMPVPKQTTCSTMGGLTNCTTY